jgi:Tol biopolymer transport system component/DNA-binding winged helix-turn-helix (wHTH) protein
VPTQTKSRVFRFGQFELDPTQQRLSRNGLRLRLPASRIRLLQLFVSRHGELITRDEIASILWGNTQTVDTVSGINTAVNQLRGHLGDDSAAPKYIETVIGTGYRFIADVEATDRTTNQAEAEVAASLDSVPEVPPGMLPARTDPGRQALPVNKVILILVVAIAAATVIFALRWRAASHPTGSGRSLELDRVTGSGDIEFADISPDGKYVAYVRAAGSEHSLWLKQVATGRVLGLASMGKEECPGLAFSADGSFVYFVRKPQLEAGGDLSRIPLLGGNSARVLGGVSGVPAISPDGREVAFVRSTLITHGEDSIVIASLDGSGERILKSYRAPGVHFNRITWTADGKSVVYPLQSGLVEISADGSSEHALPGSPWMNVNDVHDLPPSDDLVVAGQGSEISHAQVFEISLAGGAPRAITHDLSNYTTIRVTADGNSLLAVQDLVLSSLEILPPDKESGLRTLSVENQNHDGVNGVAWMPDGNLLYTSESDGRGQLQEIQPNGQHLQSLNPDLPDSILTNPVVSPRGDFIAVVQWRNFDIANIWRLNAQGTEAKRLTSGKQDFSPSITPDGQWIVYGSVEGEKSVLMKVSSEGGSPERLTDYNVDSPVVSPDGNWIACSYTPDPGRAAMLAIVPISGGPPAKVFPLPETATPRLAWSPDGKSLAFINSVNGADNLWRQALAGGPPFAATHFISGKIFSFHWARDGRIALSRGTETVDAVLLRNFRDAPDE